MAILQEAELGRLNAQIVGHLLAQRSPPRELIARRESLRAALADAANSNLTDEVAFRDQRPQSRG